MKQIGRALLLLGALYGLAEVSLRVYDSRTGQVTRADVYDRGLTAKSWFVHHELKPLLRVTTTNPDSGEDLALTTNRFGLRGGEVQVPKPSGVYRIVCLGDEQTLAAGIDQEQTFCAQLETLLQSRTRFRVEVLNAGTPGYCPLLSYLQFQHRLISLQPDLVILNFDMSDVADDYRYRRWATIDDEETPLACAHPGLQSPQDRADENLTSWLLVPQWTRQNLGRFWASRVLRQTGAGIETPAGRYAWIADQPPDWGVYLRLAFSPISQLRDLTRASYAEFVLATYPAPWQVSATASSGPGVRAAAGVGARVVYQSRQPFETLAEFSRTNGIRFCDTSPAFQSSSDGDELYLEHAPRFSPDGHVLYARELAAYLLQSFPGIWGSPTPEHRPQARSGVLNLLRQ